MFTFNYKCTKPYIINGNICKKCLDATKDNYEILCYVPKRCKTYELCLAAVTNHSHAFVHVPPKYKTYEMCMMAVKNTGEALWRVPDIHITYEMCMAAVKNNGKMLRYVPEEHKTYELCMAAITSNVGAASHIPLKFKTHEFFLDAVMTNGIALSGHNDMPKECLSRETCFAAMSNTGRARRYVPDHLKHVIKEYDFSIFLLGTHKRAGGTSPISILCDDILWTIYSFYR